MLRWKLHKAKGIDVIDSWTPVDDIGAMPKDQLCSTCYKAKLAAMQLNAYGVYDANNWKTRYGYVVKSESSLDFDEVLS
jgi:hypothetical protein